MADIVKPAEPLGQSAEGDKPKGKKRRSKTRQQKFKEQQPRPDYKPIVKENEDMSKFYNMQPILEPGEHQTFMQGLRETLPASFRINTFDPKQADFLRRLVQGPELYAFLTAPASDVATEETVECAINHHIDKEEPTDGDVKKPPALQPLCWYPKRLGWQMNVTRLDLKKSPILRQLHRFLMAETDNGFISRQEAVSMIPPLLLDVKRGQDVLDMCAAPGSKTAQLLEYLKCDIMSDDTDEPTKSDGNHSEHLFDDGMVVANDVDNKRCYMLVHQSSRLNSPNCIIINQDAARMPKMKTFLSEETKDELVDIKFDRILCDVPCSGDGTIRKNPDVWKKWSVGNANNFHGMQCKILKRGVELLKENGLLVYSTCSMNPVEDEAVIASILRASEGQVSLVDVAHKLPGLKYRPGCSDWIVMSRHMEVIPSVSEIPPEISTQIYPSLFPPSEEEAKKFQLNRCIRILPHLQDTGGFFVAVLHKKVAVLPWEVEATEAAAVTEDSDRNGDKQKAKQKATSQLPNPKKRRFAGFKEDPFIFMDEQDPDWISIRNVYGLSDSFPFNQLVHRCSSGKKRSIYLVSKKTRNFMIANREEPDRSDFVKIINGGMRLFSRADTEAGFRICQDGVNEVLPYIKPDIKVAINKLDLVALLKSRTVAIDLLSSSQDIRDRIKPGSFILIYRHEATNGGQPMEVPLVAWRGEYTIALYVANTYRVHLCALADLKIGDDCAVKEDTTGTANIKQPVVAVEQ